MKIEFKKLIINIINSKNKTNFGFKKAFTMAEVLVTLGVIGVVASVTLLTVIPAYQDYQFKVAYKKAFADANQAVISGKASGEVYSGMTSSQDGVSACANWAIFKNQFRKTRDCSNNDSNLCWDMSGESSNSAPSAGCPSFVDATGRAWALRASCSPPPTGVGMVYFLVDTNGFKKPNKYGKDRFAFWWYPYTTGEELQKITVGTDYTTSTNVILCPTGPCYYRTWLLE